MAKSQDGKELERQLEDLKKSIRKLDSVLATYSGDADNAALVRIIRQELGEKAVALQALSLSYPGSELSLAKRVARIMNSKLEQKSEMPFRRMPSPLRGLHTYSSLKSLAMRTKLERALKKAAQKGLVSGRQKSLIVFRHAGLQSPILESGTSKAEVRLLAKELGLPNWERKGDGATRHAMVRKAELVRRFLSSIGFKETRLIVHGRRIEICVPRKDMVLFARRSDIIMAKARSLGFVEASLRLC
jgi:uncharacterized protein